mmetsp:Transcript_39133/g.99143  ORF Transcript_39133/g.99143 Transcript_39133/m.99143 type:complete len:248 (-) Transcript_39133:110-853(-)
MHVHVILKHLLEACDVQRGPQLSHGIHLAADAQQVVRRGVSRPGVALGDALAGVLDACLDRHGAVDLPKAARTELLHDVVPVIQVAGVVEAVGCVLEVNRSARVLLQHGLVNRIGWVVDPLLRHMGLLLPPGTRPADQPQRAGPAAADAKRAGVPHAGAPRVLLMREWNYSSALRPAGGPWACNVVSLARRRQSPWARSSGSDCVDLRRHYALELESRVSFGTTVPVGVRARVGVGRVYARVMYFGG